MLFMGEEWAASSPFQYFTDYEDADLGRAVTEGRRREFAAFGWDPEGVADPQAPETFARSVLRWDERHEGGHGRVLDWYRQLIAVRRRTPALADGDLTTVRADADETTGLVVVGGAPPSWSSPTSGGPSGGGRSGGAALSWPPTPACGSSSGRWSCPSIRWPS
jgi:maltooligosyltrehalose trehalohydrolase